MIEYCGIFVSGGLVFTELCMKSIYIFTKWNIIYNNRAKYVHRNLILNYMYFFIVLVSLLLSYQIKVLQRENVFVYINMLLTNFFHMQEIFARFARALDLYCEYFSPWISLCCMDAMTFQLRMNEAWSQKLYIC